jgi:hypothetical protein
MAAISMEKLHRPEAVIALRRLDQRMGRLNDDDLSRLARSAVIVLGLAWYGPKSSCRPPPIFVVDPAFDGKADRRLQTEPLFGIDPNTDRSSATRRRRNTPRLPGSHAPFTRQYSR